MTGIGITTYKRPEHLRWCLTQIEKTIGDISSKVVFAEESKIIYLNAKVIVYIYDDSEHAKGIAYGKNKCLHALKDCDNIFLFDDDAAPIAPNWIDYFINSGYNHSCYMNNSYQVAFAGPVHTSYQMSSGVFIYLTRAVLDKVGYFNPKYGRYGYEHAGYSHRIFEAGLTPSRFICLNDTNKYIYALDLDGIKGYEYLDHKRTITEEERTESVRANNHIYHEETTNHQLKYEFKP